MYLENMVSILIPCYNVADSIGILLDSILQQSYTNYEIIAVNDASMDATEQELLRYQKVFLQKGIAFCYLTHKENAGAAAAINTGLKHVRGEYLIWPDADDYLTENSLEVRVEMLKKYSEYGICCGQTVQIEKSTKEVIKHMCVTSCKDTDTYFDDLLFKKIYATTQSGNMVRMSMFDKCVKNREIFVTRYGQNFQMLLPVAYSYKCVFVHEDVYYYVSSEQGNYRFHTRTYELNSKRDDLQEECLEKTIEGIPMREEERKRLRQAIIKQMISQRLTTLYNHGYYPKEKSKALQFAERLIDFAMLKQAVKDRKLWIWGANAYGRMWKDIFESQGLKVAGFIDSNKPADALEDVFAKEEIEWNPQTDYIYVSMRVFYKTVVDFLLSRDLQKGRDYYYLQEELANWRNENESL